MKNGEDEMLDFEPASDEESGNEATGGQSDDFTPDEVEDLLKPDAESDSMGSVQPKHLPPLKVAEGTTKAATTPAPPLTLHC